MVRFRFFLALAALLVASCAAAPELDQAAASTELTQPATTTTASAASSVTPNLVVDVNDLAARAGAPIICREMLKQSSNVVTTQCMTAADWKRFERREAQEAAEIVRMLQGSRYR